MPTPNRVARNRPAGRYPKPSRIVKRLKRPISILDAIVKQPVSANRVDIVLIPASQVVAVAGDEAVVKRAPDR